MESGPAPVALSGEMLVKKAQELNAKEIALQKREKNLLPLKNEIDERLAQLNELQLQLTAYAKKLADREKALDDSRIGHIVELYAAMEPARAAAIMDKLKIPTVVRILRNMKGKSAGKILSVMKPERGALISEKLTQLD
jgi:flagellar motility protein MotE (MotC chaperone)